MNIDDNYSDQIHLYILLHIANICAVIIILCVTQTNQHKIMEFNKILISVFFPLALEFVLSDYVESPKHHDISSDDSTRPTPNPEKMKISIASEQLGLDDYPDTTKPYFRHTWASSSQNHFLDNIPVGDVLSSGVNENEEILNKLIDSLTKVSSCPTYDDRTFQRIELSIEGFSYSDSYAVTIDLGSAYAVFYNIKISELSQNSSAQHKSYETKIRCDSARMAEIEVILSKDFRFSANLNVVKFGDLRLGSELEYHTITKGSISLTRKNNSISKHFSTQTIDDGDIRWKMLYSKSEVSLDISEQYQMPIMNRLQAFVDGVELPLIKFLMKKMYEKLPNNSIPLANYCSRFTYADPDSSSKENHSQVFKDDLKKLYHLPNKDANVMAGIFKSEGPILVDGLGSINKTELIISENNIFTQGGNQPATSYNDIVKEFVMKIKSNELKGKVDWTWKSKLVTTTFSIEFLEIIVKKINIFLYDGESGNYKWKNSTNVDLTSGKSEVKVSTKHKLDEKEKNKICFLQTAIFKPTFMIKLYNILEEKIQKGLLFQNCV